MSSPIQFQRYVWLAWVRVIATFAITMPFAVKADEFATPTDVFNAARAASVAKDHEGFLSCLTADSLGVLAIDAMPKIRTTREDLLKRGDLDSLTRIDDVFRKHGVDYDERADSIARVFAAAPEDFIPLWNAWLNQIADRPRFIADIDSLVIELASDEDVRRRANVIDVASKPYSIYGELLELRTADTSAKAIVNRSAGGEAILRTIKFRQDKNRGWLIHLPWDLHLGPEEVVRHGYDSPQQAYSFCRVELCQKDYREFAACLTTRSLQRVTSQLIREIYENKRMLIERQQGNDLRLAQTKATFDSFDSILRHHGFNADAIRALSDTAPDETDVKVMLHAVRDVPALFVDICEENPIRAGINIDDFRVKMRPILAAELGDIRYGVTDQGEEWAKSKIPATVNGKMGVLPMMFEKYKAGWLIHLPL